LIAEKLDLNLKARGDLGESPPPAAAAADGKALRASNWAAFSRIRETPGPGRRRPMRAVIRTSSYIPWWLAPAKPKNFKVRRAGGCLSSTFLGASALVLAAVYAVRSFHLILFKLQKKRGHPQSPRMARLC
jgi:hypothetical protein